MDLHFSIANFASLAKAKQLVEKIICSYLSSLYVLGHHHRLLLHYQHDDRSFRPPESLWAWPSWLHWHQHGSEQGAKRTFVIFFGTNKSSFIYKDFTWKNEGTDNHQETVDKAERIGKPCEADGAPEGFGDYHNLPSFLRIAENQSLCWVRLGDYCNALVNIVILLSGDYYGDFVFLLFETQNLWFLCLICISTFQVGYDNLVQSGREFVREGCLQKLSRKGYQQRMFFLVSFLSSTFSSCSST